MKGFYNTSGSARADIVDCGDIDNGAEFVANTFGSDARDCGGTTPTGGTTPNPQPVDSSCDGGVYCNNSNAINYNELQDVVVEGANTCVDNSKCLFYDEVDDEIQEVDPLYDEVLEVYGETGEWVTLDEAADILDEVGDTGIDFPSTDAEPFEEAENDLGKIPMGDEIGCTDSTASNYNPNAILSDEDLCVFDFNEDEEDNSIYLYGGIALVALLLVFKK